MRFANGGEAIAGSPDSNVFEVVPIEARHRAYVEDTFLRSVSEVWPFSMCDWSKLRKDLRDQLKRPHCNSGVAVLKKDPDTYLGWAAVIRSLNLIVYSYTTAAYRTRQGFEPRVASSLVTELGVDLTRSTSLRYWTPAAEAISKRSGWHLVRQ